MEVPITNPLEGFWMEGDSLAPPCQAEIDVVDAILELAELSQDSCIFDLGCGDGRICIRASTNYGCRSVGCEIEDRLIDEFRHNVTSSNLHNFIQVIHGDLQQLDLSSATHIVVYLLPESIEIMKSTLMDALHRGVVLIFNTWGIKDPAIKPSRRIQCGFCQNVTLLRYDKSSII